MMGHPFQIDADAIARLDEDSLARIMNRLIRAEASRLAIPPSDVLTSLRFNDRDGGIDARVDAVTTSSRWLPPGSSVWQFKGGKRAPGKAKLRDEVNKPGVRKALEQEATYCLVLGIDLVPEKHRAIESVLVSVHPRDGLAVGVEMV